MSEKIYDVPAEWKSRAFIDDAKYQAMYAHSIKDPNGFWAEAAKRIHWTKPFTKVKNTSYAPDNVSIKWFEDGVTNVSYNCVDRHLEKRGDQIAIIWEGDDPTKDRKITYKELHAEVQQFANVLKARGVKKGDRVTIYHADDPGSGLRHARLHAHRRGPFGRVRRLFAGLARRPHRGCKVDCVITADEGLRGGKPVPLKANADAAADKAGIVDDVIVVRHTGGKVAMKAGRDFYYDEIAEDGSGGMPVRADERGRPAVHPLHLRLDRKAEGRAAHHRRLSRLHVDDASIRVRLSRWRHLLVHGRRRLGDRAQLHRLWPALERRDDADVRRRAELPDRCRASGK